MSGVLDPTSSDGYADVSCPLPGCTEPLHMHRHTGLSIFPSSTVSDLRGDEHTRTWQVTCGAGHVVLLPVDDGEDVQDFGPADLDRLRKLVVPDAAHPEPQETGEGSA